MGWEKAHICQIYMYTCIYSIISYYIILHYISILYITWGKKSWRKSTQLRIREKGEGKNHCKTVAHLKQHFTALYISSGWQLQIENVTRISHFPVTVKVKTRAIVCKTGKNLMHGKRGACIQLACLITTNQSATPWWTGVMGSLITFHSALTTPS